MDPHCQLPRGEEQARIWEGRLCNLYALWNIESVSIQIQQLSYAMRWEREWFGQISSDPSQPTIYTVIYLFRGS